MDPVTRDIMTVLMTLLGAAFASSVEAALVGVTEARLGTERGAGAQPLRFWLTHSGQVLTTLHLVRLAAVLAAGMAGWSLVLAWDVPLPLAAYVGLMAFVVLGVGYLAPRTLGKAFSLRWASGTIGVVRALTVALVPLTLPFAALVRVVGWLVRAPADLVSAFWTPDEIARLAVEAETIALGKRGKELLRSIIEFSDTVIREIMVPRTEMVAIEVTSSAEEVLRSIVEARHSRVPIYEETIDNVVGILHVKDLFHALAFPEAARGASFDLRATVRQTFYVPEVMKISELLREFQRRKTHMAIVVDEYGGTAGVVTLEDIIEEIVGEIQDEYDVEEKQFRTIGDKIIADGRVSIWELEKALAVDFPDDAEYETLAGFIVSRAGYLPRAGAVISWGGLRFTIKDADEKRVGTVEIERRREAAVS